MMATVPSHHGSLGNSPKPPRFFEQVELKSAIAQQRKPQLSFDGNRPVSLQDGLLILANRFEHK